MKDWDSLVSPQGHPLVMRSVSGLAYSQMSFLNLMDPIGSVFRRPRRTLGSAPSYVGSAGVRLSRQDRESRDPYVLRGVYVSIMRRGAGIALSDPDLEIEKRADGRSTSTFCSTAPMD